MSEGDVLTGVRDGACFLTEDHYLVVHRTAVGPVVVLIPRKSNGDELDVHVDTVRSARPIRGEPDRNCLTAGQSQVLLHAILRAEPLSGGVEGVVTATLPQPSLDDNLSKIRAMVRPEGICLSKGKTHVVWGMRRPMPYGNVHDRSFRTVTQWTAQERKAILGSRLVEGDAELFEEVLTVAERKRIMHRSDGTLELLMEEDETSYDLHVVLSGKVRVLDARENPFHGPFAVVGELELLVAKPPRRRIRSVVAHDPVVVTARISAQHFDMLAARHLALWRNLAIFYADNYIQERSRASARSSPPAAVTLARRPPTTAPTLATAGTRTSAPAHRPFVDGADTLAVEMLDEVLGIAVATGRLPAEYAHPRRGAAERNGSGVQDAQTTAFDRGGVVRFHRNPDHCGEGISTLAGVDLRAAVAHTAFDRSTAIVRWLGWHLAACDGVERLPDHLRREGIRATVAAFRFEPTLGWFIGVELHRHVPYAPDEGAHTIQVMLDEGWLMNDQDRDWRAAFDHRAVP